MIGFFYSAIVFTLILMLSRVLACEMIHVFQAHSKMNIIG